MEVAFIAVRAVCTNLRCERTAAAATSRGLRILEYKSLTDQRFLIIQRRIGQEEETLRVQENRRRSFFSYVYCDARRLCCLSFHRSFPSMRRCRRLHHYSFGAKRFLSSIAPS